MTSWVTGGTWHVNGSQKENILTDLRRKLRRLLSCLLNIFSLWYGRKLLSLKYVHICYSVVYGSSPASFPCLVHVCAKCWEKLFSWEDGRDARCSWPLKWDQSLSTTKKVNSKPPWAHYSHSLWDVPSGYRILTLRRSERIGGLMEIFNLSDHN